MPLPTTRVIPEGWSRHHYPVTEGAMTGRARFMRPGVGDPVWDEETQTTIPPADTLIWSGPVRIQALNRDGRAIDAEGQDVTMGDYLVAAPWDLPELIPGVGKDYMIVEAAPDDALLVGRLLRVVNTAYGTQRWERDVWLMDDMSNQGGA